MEKPEKETTNLKNNYKFDQARQSQYLECLAKGMSRGDAAEAVGMHRSSIWEHCTRHPEFKEMISQAEMNLNDMVENALLNTSLKGNVTAQIFWLQNRSPDRWKDKRNAPIAVTNQVLSADEMKEQLKKLLEEKGNTDA